MVALTALKLPVVHRCKHLAQCNLEALKNYVCRHKRWAAQPPSESEHPCAHAVAATQSWLVTHNSRATTPTCDAGAP